MAPSENSLDERVEKTVWTISRDRDRACCELRQIGEFLSGVDDESLFTDSPHFGCAKPCEDGLVVTSRDRKRRLEGWGRSCDAIWGTNIEDDVAARKSSIV